MLIKPLLVSAGLAATLAAAAAAAAADAPTPRPAEPGTGAAWPDTAAPSTLRAALEHAWARTPAARALNARHEQARAAADAAGSTLAGPPTLSLGVLDDRLHRRAGRREWEAEIGMPLWLPGQRGAQQSVAQARLHDLAEGAAARRLQLAGELREAWWALAATREDAALQRGRLDAARVLQADVERRVRAGELARTDALLATGEAHAAEAALADALLQERLAADRLRALTGTPVPAALAPEGLAEAEAPPAPHPRLAAAAAAVRLAQARLALVARSTREAPEVALRLQRERDGVGERWADRVGVRLSVPLGSAPRQLRDSAEVRAELLEAQAEEALLQSQLALDIDAARRERDTAEAKAALAASRAALAAEALQLIHKSFALGESDLPALLGAQAADFDARAEVRRLEVARAAAASRLRQALGVMP
ncbi:TolC family protein [Azohydromonas aeria]|uniref:TolC family protein n=1 Tax=Azohydromonas aeria TaxID=2590212 RepID=UPI0012F9C954|nr:TolC family protein [Azohydromonas aeria]